MRRLGLLAAVFAMPLLCTSSTGVKLPAYTRQVLPNGVVVDLMPKPGVPLVGIRIVVRGGAEADSPDLAGLGAITAQLLRKGTEKRNADQFSAELDSLGGSFNVFTDGYAPATNITSEFLTKDFDAGLDLVSDAVLHPIFPDAEVRKLIAQRTDAIHAAKDNPQQSIGYYYQAFFFGPSHPYGHPADESTLGRIRREDIVHQHKRLYCGRNMIVVVSGDFDSAQIQAKIARAFGDAPAGEVFERTSNAQIAAGPRLLLVDKPDATQTYFQIGQPGIDRRNPDRTKLLVLNTLFGGRFTSMLNEALRVESGLTYGAFSTVQQFRLPASILISTYTKTETTGKAIDMALDVLNKFGENGITADQLASSKAYIKGTFPTQRLETSDELATIVSELELYGLGTDEIDGLFSRIDALTLEEANAAARKYYRTDRLTFVVIGNASKIRDAVQKYATNITELKVSSPGFR